MKKPIKTNKPAKKMIKATFKPSKRGVKKPTHPQGTVY